jgi:hypothetical protein
MKLNISCTAGFFVAVLSASGQISQDHPELCGKPGAFVAIPPNVSATIDAGGGEAVVSIDTGNSVKTISIRGLANALEELCPLQGNQAILFGNASDVTTNIAIIDMGKGSLVDSFYGNSPRLSPDRRWLVYGKFHSRGAESASEEYLLYDLTKSPSENRPPGILDSNRDDVGRAIFPLGQKNTLADNIGLPQNQIHSNKSNGFFWSTDSKMIVFADIVDSVLSVVSIALDSDTSSKALMSAPISVADACSGGGPQSPGGLIVTNAEIIPSADGDQLIRVEFFPVLGCVPKPLEVRAKSFRPAPVEVHMEQPKRKRAVVVDH